MKAISEQNTPFRDYDDAVMHDSPPREEGWTRHQEEYREASFHWSGRGGRSQVRLRNAF